MDINKTGGDGGIKPLKPAAEQIAKEELAAKRAPGKGSGDTIGRSTAALPPAGKSIVTDPLAYQAPSPAVAGFQAVSPAATYNMLMAIGAYNDMFTSEAYEANSVMQGISTLSSYVQSFAEQIENWTIEINNVQNQLQAEQLPSWEKWMSMGVQVIQAAAIGFIIGGPAGAVIGAAGAIINIALSTSWSAGGESVFDRICGNMTPTEAALTKVGMSVGIGLVTGGAYAGLSSALSGFMSGAEEGITTSLVEEEASITSSVKPPAAEEPSTSTVKEEVDEGAGVGGPEESPEEISTEEEQMVSKEEETATTQKENAKAEEKISAKETKEDVEKSDQGKATKTGAKPVDKTSSTWQRARAIGINSSISMIEGFSSKMNVQVAGSTTPVEEEETLIGQLALAITGDKENGLYAGITMVGSLVLQVGGMVLGYAVSPASLMSDQSSIITKIFSGLSFASTFAQSAGATANSYEQLKMVSQYRELGEYTYDLGVADTDTTLGQTARQQLLDFMNTVLTQNMNFAEAVQSLAQDVTTPIQKLYEG